MGWPARASGRGWAAAAAAAVVCTARTGAAIRPACTTRTPCRMYCEPPKAAASYERPCRGESTPELAAGARQGRCGLLAGLDTVNVDGGERSACRRMTGRQ